MGFTRDVANIATLGAFSRVEEAKESYDSAVWRYNSYKRDIDDYIKGVEIYSKAIEKAQKALEQNKDLLNKISHDQSVISRLTSQEQDSLKQYMTTNAVTACIGLQKKQGWNLEYSGFEHDSEMEASAITTCALFPVLAQIFINSEASKQIESINSQKSQVIDATKELSKKAAEVGKVYEKSKQTLNMISVVMDIVINNLNVFYRCSRNSTRSVLIDAKRNIEKVKDDEIHSRIEYNRIRKRERPSSITARIKECLDSGDYNVVSVGLSDL